MTAHTATIYRHQAYCNECGWWSDEVESDDTAQQDADEHNEEYHND